jgi:hypothetical protein
MYKHSSLLSPPELVSTYYIKIATKTFLLLTTMCAQLAYGNNISVKINAIVPTSHGQIGVNPITDIPLDV